MNRKRKAMSTLMGRNAQKKKDALADMLSLSNEAAIKWTPELRDLWTLVANNQFTLVSGKAGTGKSYLLRQLQELCSSHLKSAETVTVAPTAKAAVNAGGITVHSWLGLGLAKQPIDRIVFKIDKGWCEKTETNLSETDILLIDEVSMLDADFFDKISKVCQAVKKNYSDYFGGIRLVMFGDFLQLPPIGQGVTPPFVFLSELWKKMHVKRYMLRHVYRQDNTSQFVDVLNNVRKGQVTNSVAAFLKSRVVREPPDGIFTRLCAYRNTVKEFNADKLAELPGEVASFTAGISLEQRKPKTSLSAADKDEFGKKFRTTEMAAKVVDKDFNVPFRLSLKVGAQVMYRCNFCVEEGVYNGSLGTVTAIRNASVNVHFANGAQVEVGSMEFSCRVGRTGKVVVKQLPLSLAWAMSIHKSQGMTLDRVLVDISCFEFGQFYVGISRVKTPEGLFLHGHPGLLKKAVRASPHAIQFEDDAFSELLVLGALFDEGCSLHRAMQLPISDINVFRVLHDFL